jgi:AAA family ATP:ADP antiporter
MPSKSTIDKLLAPVSDVRAGEGARALGMLASLLVFMIAYYLLKTVRESLILSTGGAELKSYAAGLQALMLMAFVPAYGWLSRRVGRRGLIVGLTGFFFFNLQAFYLGMRLGAPYIGVAFFVWVGIFSLSVIAQFWSVANDLYSQGEGERLFPIIAFGATLGSPVGARVAEALFDRGVAPQTMLELAAVLLLAHGALTLWLARGASASASVAAAAAADRPLAGTAGGFQLIARNSYLRWVALLLVLLNVVNTVGEYLLGKNAVAAAAAAVASGHAASKAAFIGSFYGSFFFWVNVTAALLQGLVVSRLVKRFGVKGVIAFLPIVAFGVYGAIALGAGFGVVRLMKAAENASDYSVMNTGRAMLWLPTTREEKYRAKQAMDTFFVRFGDVLATAIVFTGVSLLHLGPHTLAIVNTALSTVWIALALTVARRNRALSTATAPATRHETRQRRVERALSTQPIAARG